MYSVSEAAYVLNGVQHSTI